MIVFNRVLGFYLRILLKTKNLKILYTRKCYFLKPKFNRFPCYFSIKKNFQNYQSYPISTRNHSWRLICEYSFHSKTYIWVWNQNRFYGLDFQHFFFFFLWKFQYDPERSVLKEICLTKRAFDFNWCNGSKCQKC